MKTIILTALVSIGMLTVGSGKAEAGRLGRAIFGPRVVRCGPGPAVVVAPPAPVVGAALQAGFLGVHLRPCLGVPRVAFSVPGPIAIPSIGFQLQIGAPAYLNVVPSYAPVPYAVPCR